MRLREENCLDSSTTSLKRSTYITAASPSLVRASELSLVSLTPDHNEDRQLPRLLPDGCRDTKLLASIPTLRTAALSKMHLTQNDPNARLRPVPASTLEASLTFAQR